MNPDYLTFAVLGLASIPAVLFLINWFFYRPLRRADSAAQVLPVSVLIPARNEERNIRAALDSVLASRDCDFEVVVLDDNSTDRTAQIVLEFAARDPRVRLETAPPLPSGWCGKQHACYILSQLAKHDLLVFMDADVKLAADALVRMARFMTERKPALASGVPRQQLGTLSEKLLIPQIHFILLGFLPMPVMRWSRMTGFSAGCGQLFIARRDAYRQCGGHAMLRDSLHDGVKLPRAFRRAGFSTDLFDATDIATCRMYQTDADTWRGLGKNATEGLAAPGTLGPMTVLLLGGQVLPFALLAGAALLPVSVPLLCLAVLLVYAPRFLAVLRFRQPFLSAWLHPVGVLALLAIQWNAFLRQRKGEPLVWKGRAYPASGIVKIGKAGELEHAS